MKKRILFALVLLLLLSSYNIQKNINLNPRLNIEKIYVENNNFIDEKILKNKLSFLYKTNLFLLKKKDIELNLKELDIIESFEIKKIFPNKIRIKVYENLPIAIIQNKAEKKFYTKSGKTINFFELEEFSNLPIVYADSGSFTDFYKVLKKINFPFNEIVKFYLFESKRWDIVTKDKQTIKLPIKNYETSLKNFIDLKDQINFRKYKIFDYRINNQIILK
ncbi:FtsQ-type POTRA domain-containing protein [Candidatus Pelagibacter bacterium]|nr:FtsQ-type POTRA domain-containing protein [Candidatus Pelagibacter bacterium]